MRIRAFFAVSMILLMHAWAYAQVPIDLSQAKEFRVILSVDVGRGPGAPYVVTAPCENEGRDFVSVPSMGGGRSLFTLPRIDTNAAPPDGFRSTYMPIDYDGVSPHEYMNQNGRVDACASGVYPFQKSPLDTIQCWASYLNMERSVDIDGDGFLDILCNIGGNGATAWIIFGGPAAGQGCERMLLVPVVKSGNKYNITKAFYKSAVGEWRLIQQERDSLDRAPRLQMYRVTFTRTEGKPDITFTPLGRYQGEDVSQIDEPYGEICVVVDSINGTDHMLMDHRIGPPGSQWALERFDVTTGQIVSSGEVVSGYDFYVDNYNDLQYTLGTSKPLIVIGYLFCYVDDLSHPIARWNPKGSGTQPYVGMTAVNDQSGDGTPDLVVVGGGVNGTMVVLTLDSTSTAVHSEDGDSVRFNVRLLGAGVEVASSTDGLLTIHIAALDGRLVSSLPPIAVSAGVTSIDLEPQIRPLTSGPYFLRVSVNDQVNTISILN